MCPEGGGLSQNECWKVTEKTLQTQTYSKKWLIFSTLSKIIISRQIQLQLRMFPYNIFYGAETWTLTKQAQNKLAAAQTKIEKYAQHQIKRRTNIWVADRIKVIDIFSNVRKWSGSGQCTSTASKTTDGPRVSPLGDQTKKTTRETSQAVERRPRQILERHDLAEDSERRANLEAACWDLRSTTWHCGCPMIIMMSCSIRQCAWLWQVKPN